MSALDLFYVGEKKSSNYIKSQLKKIKNKKSNIDIENVLNKINEKLKEKYTITSITSTELIMKIDRKKKIDELEVFKEIKEIIQENINNNIDVELLFKIFKINNEFIVRAKRKLK